MKLKGTIGRIKEEYQYFTSKNWTYKETGEFWDTVHDYDEIDDETYAYKRRFYDTIKMFKYKEKGKILDMDCRTGNGSVFYFQNEKVSNSTCISPSEVFLSVCKKRMEKYGIPNRIILLRKTPLDFKDNSFDTALCFETLEHVSKKDHRLFLKEIYRGLKKEGIAVFTMPNILWEPVHWIVAVFGIHHSEGPHNFLKRKVAEKMLRKTGFKILKEDTTVIIPSGPKWFTQFGEFIEKIMGKRLRHIFALRHIFICKK